MTVKGDQGTVRALNRRLLLRLLREQGPTSRTALAERSGLSNGAVTRIVSELIDDGFLFERSVGNSTGGRRPVLLDLDTSARVVAGVKLMDDAILAVLVDTKGTVVVDGRGRIRSHGTAAVLHQADKLVRRLLDTASIPHDRLAGVGLCMPGAVDWRNGVCKLSPFFGWENVPVADTLHELIGVPVFVDNDVNALAVAESLFGRGRWARDFVVVTLGRGVGAGLVYDGAVHRGHSGGAGEFGHLVSELGGRLCECGKRGCLEAYVGERAIRERVGELYGEYGQVELDAFFRLARGGDANADLVYADVLRRLGAAVANLVNLLNPELVVLGGEAAFLTEDFVADLRPHITEHAFGGLIDSFQVELDDWRDDRTAWARGAASLAMEYMFDPLIENHAIATA